MSKRYDIYDKRIEFLNFNLPGRAVILDHFPLNLSPGIYAQLKGGAAGWYNENSGEVCLYRPNLTGKDVNIDSIVTFLHVSKKGLEHFLGTSDYKDLCFRLGREVYGHGASSFTREENIAAGRQFLSSLSAKDNDGWAMVTRLLSNITGLKDTHSLENSLRKGLENYSKLSFNKALTEGNQSVLKQVLDDKLSKSKIEPQVLTLGMTDDVFERLGYPSVKLNISSETVKKFERNSGYDLSSVSGTDALFKIFDPLVVFDDRRSNTSQFVTDCFVPGRGYMTFGIQSPNGVRKGIESGRYSTMRVCNVHFTSEYWLLNVLGADNGGRILYLKPKFGKAGNSYVVSDCLRRMQDRSIEELGYKKSVGGKALDLTPLQLSRRLIITANIVENFKNPISAEKRLKLFGKSKYDSMVEDRYQNVEKNIDIDFKTKKPVKEVSVTDNRSYKERLNTYCDDHFSKAALKKLKESGINKAMDVISFGAENFNRRFGIRAYKCAISFLEDNGLAFSNGHKIKTINEVSVKEMSEEDIRRLKYMDLANSLVYVPVNVMTRLIRMPRCSSGKYYSGADAVNLVSKSVSIPRWRDCNIFMDQTELQKYGIKINAGAIPCYISDVGGSSKVVYNFSETDFAVNHPSLFDVLSDLSRKTSAEVPGYVRNLIYTCAGEGHSDAEGLYAFFERSYKNRDIAGQLGPESMNVLQLAAQASRIVGIRNPLETRGRKAKPKDVYEQMMQIDKGIGMIVGKKK